MALKRNGYIEEATFSPYGYTISALRLLYAENNSSPGKPFRLTSKQFDQAAARACERPGTVALNIMSKLEDIAEIAFRYDLTEWKETWIRDRRVHTVVVNKKPLEEKIPNNRELAALAEISRSEDLCHLDAVRQCAIDLMLACGFRVNEVLTLPLDTLYQELVTDEHGELVCDEEGRPVRKYGLRYWPEKGGSGHVLLKAVPSVMVPVVLRALDRAKKLTEPAREIARHQYTNPGSTRLGGHWDTLPPNAFLGPEEVADALQLQGKARHALGKGFLVDNAVPYTIRNVVVKGREYARPFTRKKDLYQKLYELSFHENCCPREPVLVHLHECLFIMRWHTKREHPGIRGTVLPLRDHSMMQHISPGRKSWSVFTEVGIDDSCSMHVTTHEFRNLLNHIAIEGGISQIDLAHWMGRVDVRSNAAYHRQSPEHQASQLRTSLIQGRGMSASEPVAHHSLSSGELLASDGAGHVSETGACERDLGGIPCQYYAERNRLGRMPRGLTPLKSEEVDKILHETHRLREAAVQEALEGSAGAQQWIDSHDATIAAASALASSSRPRDEDRQLTEKQEGSRL